MFKYCTSIFFFAELDDGRRGAEYSRVAWSSKSLNYLNIFLNYTYFFKLFRTTCTVSRTRCIILSGNRQCTTTTTRWSWSSYNISIWLTNTTGFPFGFAVSTFCTGLKIRSGAVETSTSLSY